MKETAGMEEEKTIPNRALLFELEYSAVPGRRILYDVLENVLSGKKMKLTRSLFSKHCMHGSMENSLASLLKDIGKERVSSQKMAEEINEGMSMSFKDGAVKIFSPFYRLLERANEQKVALGALTTLDREASEELISHLHLADMGVVLQHVPRDMRMPEVMDAWSELADRVKVAPSRCLVIATSFLSCRAAMAVGMVSVAAPDEFTSFEDFSGVDVILDSNDVKADGTIAELLDVWA